MIGNSSLPKFSIPQSFEVTIAAPIDTRSTIDNNLTANLAVQIPVGIRYAGLKVWVNYIYADITDSGSTQSQGEYYYFRPNYLLSDPFAAANLIFTPLIDQITLGLKTFKTVIASVVANTPITIVHSLGSCSLEVTATSLSSINNLMTYFQPEWRYDESVITSGDPGNTSSFSVNSKYHSIIFSSKLALPNVTISIISKL